MPRLSWKYLILCLVPVLALPPVVEGAEFSAKMVLTQQGQDMPGKIYVKDKKMRQEFLDDRGHTITIVRRDKNRIWVIMPMENSYVDMPLGLHLPGQFLQIKSHYPRSITIKRCRKLVQDPERRFALN